MSFRAARKYLWMNVMYLGIRAVSPSGLGQSSHVVAFDEVDGVCFESFQSFFYLTISNKDLFSLADQLLQ